jgi:hypothetical protein
MKVKDWRFDMRRGGKDFVYGEITSFVGCFGCLWRRFRVRAVHHWSATDGEINVNTIPPSLVRVVGNEKGVLIDFGR